MLKGTSGIQAGTSAPGGLVNLVVKRPEGSVRSARFEAREGGGTAFAIDLGDRFGNDERFGVRANVAYEDLDPQTRSACGHSSLVAVAADARLPTGTLVEVEFESSRQQQPSVPGFSLLGDRMPDAGTIDPRTNLNNQPWSQPVVLDGNTDVAARNAPFGPYLAVFAFSPCLADRWNERTCPAALIPERRPSSSSTPR